MSEDTSVDFTPDTAAGIRSVTKTLTEALVLKADEHVVSQGSSSILNLPISNWSVITNNIERWENRFIPPEVRAAGAGKRKPPVHTDCTLTDIAAHTAQIYPVGKWEDTATGETGPVMNVLNFNTQNMSDNMLGLKIFQEPLATVDDIVAMAGAVQSGVDNFTNLTKPTNGYNDLAGWLAGAICEEILGNSWFNLITQQLEIIGGAEGLNSSYPSTGGEAFYWGSHESGWAAFFQNHNANLNLTPNLATRYIRGPITDSHPLGLYDKPYESPDITYAIGCAAMSAKDLARWAMELRWPTNGTPYLSQGNIDKMFSNQTGQPDHYDDDNSNWPDRNRGFGTYKMKPVLDVEGNEIETYGSMGFGGLGGGGAGVVWIRARNYWDTGDMNCVFTGVTNFNRSSATEMNPYEIAYEMAADFAASYVRAVPTS